MLNVTPQRSPEAAKSYFAKSDYYSEGQELVGNWGGKGAVLLGLFGTVEKNKFDRLCDNLHPHTGEPLTPIDLAPKNESSRNVRISAISKGARTC
jgi:TrwC relaxase